MIGSRIGLIAAVISVLLTSACAAPSAAPPAPAPRQEAAAPTPTPVPKVEKVTIQVTNKIVPFINFFIGKDKGLYKEENLDAEIILMTTTTAMAALVAGNIDYVGIVTAFEAALAGAPVKLLLNTIKKPPWHIYGAPGVNTVADLKGKAVGVSGIGVIDHYVIKETLRALGVNVDKDVTFIPVRSAERFAALKAGSIGAAGLSSPIDLQARDTGLKKLAYSGDYMDIPIDGLGATDKKLKENPAQVKRAIRGTLKSMNYLKDKPQETRDYMIKELEIDPKIINDVYNDLLGSISLDGSIPPKGIQAMVESGKSSGAIRGEAVIEKGLDFTLLKEAQKELKLVP